MLDFGRYELLIVAVVILVVVKPEELPGLMRSCGKMIAKVRKMSKDFTSAIDDAVNEAGVKDITKIMGDDGDEYETFDVSDIHERGSKRKGKLAPLEITDDILDEDELPIKIIESEDAAEPETVDAMAEVEAVKGKANG